MNIPELYCTAMTATQFIQTPIGCP